MNQSLHKNFQCSKLHFLFKSGDNSVDYNDTNETFRSEAKINCNKNEWSSLVCVMASSTIINSPIYSIYSPKSNTRHYNVFTREFKPRKADANSKTLTLLLSTTEDISVYTKPNHIVLCMDIKNSRNMNIHLSSREKKTNIGNKQTKISFLPKQKIQYIYNDINNINFGTAAKKD